MSERSFYIQENETEDCSLNGIYSYEDYQRDIFDAEMLFISRHSK